MIVPFSLRSRLFLAGLLVTLLISSQPVGAKAAKMLDLPASVEANRILSELSAVIQGSDLGTFLSSRGPFTLFAPTNSAFSKLPPGMLAYLLRPENKELLQRVLLYHVVNGKRLTSKDLVTNLQLPSSEGSILPVKTTKSGIQFVGKARIIHADIQTLNGVIHQIDTVLIPPDSPLPKGPLPPPAVVPVAAPVTPLTNAPSDLPPATTNEVAPVPPAETNK